MTTVVSVRGMDRAALLADPSFVYVGRRCAGWPASVWGNPFKPGMDWGPAVVAVGKLVPGRVRLDFPTGAFTAADCIDLYRQYMSLRPDLAALLPTLRGKRLGCWCGAWSPGGPDLLCHAVVLAQLTEAR